MEEKKKWEKRVDESWKEAAEKEKETLAGAARPTPAPETPAEKGQEAAPTAEEASAGTEGSSVNFLEYVTTLAYQAMVFLGEIPNPVTNESQKNLDQAKFLIDTLIMLREKTRGNLTKQESDVLNTTAYELQVKYVDALQKEATAP